MHLQHDNCCSGEEGATHELVEDAGEDTNNDGLVEDALLQDDPEDEDVPVLYNHHPEANNGTLTPDEVCVYLISCIYIYFDTD